MGAYSDGVPDSRLQAHSWDVPMELRCASNAALTNWSDPIWIYPVYYCKTTIPPPTRVSGRPNPHSRKASSAGLQKQGGDGGWRGGKGNCPFSVVAVGRW